MDKNELKVEYLPISELKQYSRNTRRHIDYDVSQIATSIKKYGFNDPIGVWGKDNTIVEGHGRLMAAKSLGMTSVPVIRLDHLTDEERREYAIMHNKTAEFSSWDEEMLRLELPDLDLSDFDFEWDFDLGDDNKEPVHDDDFVPEVPVKPKSVRGKIYELGKHRLMCGDSTKSEDVQALMNGEMADLVFTDPPWNVNYGGDHLEGSNFKKRTIENDFMSTEAFKEFMYSAFRCMNEVSKPGAMTYVVMSAQEWGNMMLALKDNNYHWSSTIIWNKNRMVLARKDYHTKYEPIWYGWKNGAPRLCPLDDRTQSDVWDFDRPNRSDEHPTMKPVPLVAKAIENSSHKNDVVLDLFGGSGTTLIACEETSRVCYMMELDPHYVEVIIDRWIELTGREVYVLEDDGRRVPWSTIDRHDAYNLFNPDPD